LSCVGWRSGSGDPINSRTATQSGSGERCGSVCGAGVGVLRTTAKKKAKKFGASRLKQDKFFFKFSFSVGG